MPVVIKEGALLESSAAVVDTRNSSATVHSTAPQVYGVCSMAWNERI
jgi:hypothetical protein